MSETPKAKRNVFRPSDPLNAAKTGDEAIFEVKNNPPPADDPFIIDDKKKSGHAADHAKHGAPNTQGTPQGGPGVPSSFNDTALENETPGPRVEDPADGAETSDSFTYDQVLTSEGDATQMTNPQEASFQGGAAPQGTGVPHGAAPSSHGAGAQNAAHHTAPRGQAPVNATASPSSSFASYGGAMNEGTYASASGRRGASSVVFWLVCIVLAAVLAYLIPSTITHANEAAQNAYAEAKMNKSEEVYQGFYNTAYGVSESKYHVSNEVSISVTGFKETAKLEVLKVDDIEYIVTDTSKGEGILKWIEDTFTAKINTWTKVPASAVFTVNLEASEVIVDEDRQYVLVRVPAPQLGEPTIDYKNVELLEFSSTGYQSVGAGEDHIREQLEEATLLLRERMSTNQLFYKSAKASAVTLITNMIKALNPDLPDLEVEVLFFE